MNIGKYANWSDTLIGLGGKLDLGYWVLQYDLQNAKNQFEQVKPMLRAFEYWFGKYPWYEDGYKLVEAPFLGLENQSAVAYGNGFQNGYKGRDISGTGWGTKWDFIIVHESGHEWFGNNITSKDIADMWLHEGFTNYAEVLFTETYYGKKAADEYCFGLRKNIKNDIPVIGIYGVNEEGSTDMYYKASNMIHTIRHSMHDDSLFRNILHGLNTDFYHQTVTTQQVEAYISNQSGFDYSKVFDQYLRTTEVPVLQFYFADQKVYYRYTNCVRGFNLPIYLEDDDNSVSIHPTDKWQSSRVTKKQQLLIDRPRIEMNYYLRVEAVESR
jgi:aminopeptidase N